MTCPLITFAVRPKMRTFTQGKHINIVPLWHLPILKNRLFRSHGGRLPSCWIPIRQSDSCFCVHALSSRLYFLVSTRIPSGACLLWLNLQRECFCQYPVVLEMFDQTYLWFRSTHAVIILIILPPHKC